MPYELAESSHKDCNSRSSQQVSNSYLPLKATHDGTLLPKTKIIVDVKFEWHYLHIHDRNLSDSCSTILKYRTITTESTKRPRPSYLGKKPQESTKGKPEKMDRTIWAGHDVAQITGVTLAIGGSSVVSLQRIEMRS